MKNKALPQRQLEVMQILWESEKSMTANVIAAETELGINTVQASLRSLAQKKYIKVDDIVYSGTVLTRAYAPIISREEYLQRICGIIKDIDAIRITANAVISQVTDTETLDEIARAIEQRKKELENGREK